MRENFDLFGYLDCFSLFFLFTLLRHLVGYLDWIDYARLVGKRCFLRPRPTPETKDPETIPMAARKVHKQKLINEEEQQPHILWWKDVC
jgi:hypothetical protein